MHWVRIGTCVCVCVRRGGLSERSSDVEVVVSQISAGDGVSVCGGCGRERDEEGCVCQLDVRWREWVSCPPSLLPPSSPSLFSLSSDPHAICMEL